MNGFLWNIMLALVWAFLTGDFAPTNLAIGFLIGTIVLWIVQYAIGIPTYLRKVRQAIVLMVFFVWQLVLANLRVAFDVVTRPFYMRPGIIAIPLDARTDAEITLLANLITLTPGSLSIDVSTDRRVLYVHSMYIDDEEALRKIIKDGFERRVLELLR